MSQHNETILIVEDNVQIQNFISYILKQEGFHYVTAGTAQGGLSELDLYLYCY